MRESHAVELAAYERADVRTIYVVGHGWHTGLILKTSDISPAIWPEILDFQDTDAVEFGWGDEGFYRTAAVTPWLITKAFFLPSASVLHVSGYHGSVREVYPYSDIVQIDLTDRQFENLSRFVSRTFRRDGEGDSESLGPGLYGKSEFYRANGAYYFPKTCNFWTARALAAADCPIVPLSGATAESVLFQARLSGKVIQRSPWGLKAAALRRQE